MLGWLSPPFNLCEDSLLHWLLPVEPSGRVRRAIDGRKRRSHLRCFQAVCVESSLGWKLAVLRSLPLHTASAGLLQAGERLPLLQRTQHIIRTAYAGTAEYNRTFYFCLVQAGQY